MDWIFLYVILGLIIVGLFVFVLHIKIVPQSYAFVIEKLGVYATTWSAGLHILVPFFDRIVRKISLKERVVDYPPQPVITKDNVTMQIDTVVYFQVTDPKLFTYGHENPLSAIEKLTATTLRNIIGDLELDETLTSRDIINGKMRVLLDEATDPWGIKVNRVEVKNIMPPPDIQDAMEKQMRAERERRELILKAEGEKRSAILIAEGQKESAVLKADGVREATIKEAEGRSEAIMKIAQAKAQEVKLLRDAGADDKVIAMKSLEAFAKAADGQATKIIIPSEIQSIAGLSASVMEVLSRNQPASRSAKKE